MQSYTVLFTYIKITRFLSSLKRTTDFISHNLVKIVEVEKNVYADRETEQIKPENMM